MPHIVSDEAQLAQAIDRGEVEIVLEGKLGKLAVRIKNVPWYVWIVVVVAIMAAVVIVLASAGVATPAAIGAAAASVAAIGYAPTVFGIKVAGASGGTAVLERLRNEYVIVLQNDDRVVLHKK